jgi:NlpC/P60 family
MSETLRTRPSGLPNFVDHSVGREEVSIEAMSLIGVPYRWAGNTPASGFDCSGLVQYVLGRAADVKLPRTTADMSQNGQAIEPDEIAPGDLVFFNTTGRPHSHVGIYVGKLRFVNAPSTGGTVRLDYLTNPYWAKRFDGIRRVAPPRERPTPFDAPTYLASPREMPDESASVTAPAPAQARTNAKQDATTSGAPDAIDAAADAFEPPPAAGQAERQARVAGTRSVVSQTLPGVQIMRASGMPSVQPAPTSTKDDPIARFANGGE